MTARYIEPDLKWELLKGEKRVHSGLAFLFVFELPFALLEQERPVVGALPAVGQPNLPTSLRQVSTL